MAGTEASTGDDCLGILGGTVPVVPSSRHEAVTAESDVTVYAFQGCGMDWAAGGRLLTFVDAGKGSRDQGDGYVVSG